ncbi:MAG: hypothetical protein K2X27_21345 [Candidatus Obscuribacterales bacterium]|nr:hypothetical protein [Candidatus Obscuribacterales bacterium]
MAGDKPEADRNNRNKPDFEAANGESFQTQKQDSDALIQARERESRADSPELKLLSMEELLKENGITGSERKNGESAGSFERSATQEELSKEFDSLRTVLNERGINPDRIASFNELQERAAEINMVSDDPKYIGKQAGYISDIKNAVETGRLNKAEQIEELFAMMDGNYKALGSAISLDSRWDALVRSENAGKNLDGIMAWQNNTPAQTATEKTRFSAVGQPPQLHFLNLPGWQIESINPDGSLNLSHDGKMKVKPESLARRDISSNFEKLSENPDGTVNVQAKDFMRAKDADGKPSTIRVRVSASELLMSTMQAHGFTDDCAYAVTAFLKNASNPEGLAEAIKEGKILTSSKLKQNLQRGGDVSSSQLLDMVGTNTEMATRAVNPPRLENAKAGLYLALAEGKEKEKRVIHHTFLISVNEAGKAEILDVSLGKSRPLDPRMELMRLYKLEGEKGEQAKRNLGLAKAAQDPEKSAGKVSRAAEGEPLYLEVPKLESLSGTKALQGADGTIEHESRNPGKKTGENTAESARLSGTTIDELKRTKEKLEASKNSEDKEKARCLAETIDALEGRKGKAQMELAHKTFLAEAEKSGSGHFGRLSGIAVLTASLLAQFKSNQTKEEMERAKVN